MAVKGPVPTTTKAEAKMRDAIVPYLRRHGFEAKPEVYMRDADMVGYWARPDIVMKHDGHTWLMELKAWGGDYYKGLGQATHYLTLAHYEGYKPPCHAALVVEEDPNWPTDCFIETCEWCDVEVWTWDGKRLLHRRSRFSRPLKSLPNHPLRELVHRAPLAA